MGLCPDSIVGHKSGQLDCLAAPRRKRLEIAAGKASGYPPGFTSGRVSLRSMGSRLREPGSLLESHSFYNLSATI